jgi:large subunit ribosomal protein L25
MKDLPDELPVDITKLQLDHTIKAGDLKFEGVTIVSPKSTVICGVKTTRNTVVTEEVAE